MKIHEGVLDAKGRKFGLVVSRFNSLFTEQLLKGAEDCLVRHGAAAADIAAVRVPGAAEIPLAAQRLAKSGKFDAVVALGCVIQGATPHAGLINAEVAKALTQIGLETGVPVVSGLIAADSIEQAVERSGTKAGNKGWDAAAAAIEMVSVMGKI
ncbi:MAG: 6,7-dimethyl-8-ribityllumazine synthase [Kiritimatiellaeota bacterium]|nr:6,7-dimethyl-8-ribityllumazine synthase [Kiritimatiellota bacterium]